MDHNIQLYVVQIYRSHLLGTSSLSTHYKLPSLQITPNLLQAILSVVCFLKILSYTFLKLKGLTYFYVVCVVYALYILMPLDEKMRNSFQGRQVFVP